MKQIMDLTGQVFGKWTVISPDADRPKYSICQCECGVVQSRKNAQLRWAAKKGMKQACIKCAGTKHGEFRKTEYVTWRTMIDRCSRETHPFFHRYGGRGISVCERWMIYDNFLADMGRRPAGNYSIDRINNDGNYEPNNCRWTTQKVQLRNTSVNHDLTFKGETKCLAEWSEETGFSIQLIRQRIQIYGWSIDDALTIKPEKNCNWRGTTHKDSELLTYNGESLPHSAWAKRLGISRDTIRNRLKRGWTVEKAVTTRGRNAQASHHTSLGRDI